MRVRAMACLEKTDLAIERLQNSWHASKMGQIFEKENREKRRGS